MSAQSERVRIADDGTWSAPVEIPSDIWAEIDATRNANWYVRDVLSEHPPSPEDVVTMDRLVEAWATRRGIVSPAQREVAAVAWLRHLVTGHDS